MIIKSTGCFTLILAVIAMATSLTTQQINTSQVRDEVAALASMAHQQALNFDFDGALTTINAAVALDPDDPSLYVQRGQVHLLLYQWDNVLADYNQALEIDPEYADAYFYRGVLYYTVVVDRDKALPDFQRYLELAPQGEHAAEAAQYRADIQSQLDALKK